MDIYSTSHDKKSVSGTENYPSFWKFFSTQINLFQYFADDVLILRNFPRLGKRPTFLKICQTLIHQDQIFVDSVLNFLELFPILANNLFSIYNQKTQTGPQNNGWDEFDLDKFWKMLGISPAPLGYICYNSKRDCSQNRKRVPIIVVSVHKILA